MISIYNRDESGRNLKKSMYENFMFPFKKARQVVIMMTGRAK